MLMPPVLLSWLLLAPESLRALAQPLPLPRAQSSDSPGRGLPSGRDLVIGGSALLLGGGIATMIWRIQTLQAEVGRLRRGGGGGGSGGGAGSEAPRRGPLGPTDVGYRLNLALQQLGVAEALLVDPNAGDSKKAQALAHVRAAEETVERASVMERHPDAIDAGQWIVPDDMPEAVLLCIFPVDSPRTRYFHGEEFNTLIFQCANEHNLDPRHYSHWRVANSAIFRHTPRGGGTTPGGAPSSPPPTSSLYKTAAEATNPAGRRPLDKWRQQVAWHAREALRKSVQPGASGGGTFFGMPGNAGGGSRAGAGQRFVVKPLRS